MHWIAPSEKDAGTDTLEKRLWDAADQLRANSASEQEILQKLIESRTVDVMVAVGSTHCFRRTRDLLLPRLLSGQVNLEENQKL